MGKLTNILQRIKFEARTLYCELHSDCVAVNSYAWLNYDGLVDRSNWGDDINWFFLREIIDGHLISYDHSRITRALHKPNYVVIGSTIDLRADCDSVIWGAGIIDGNVSKLPDFREIRAVRGPLTRAKLIDLGYDCPEVYGDPALLIPMHYNPVVTKKYRLGVIPHFHDLDTVRSQWGNREDILLIDISHYRHWHDFIDEALSCEAIASSSLHGLIMAHAYGVPNVWIEFDDGEQRDPFKYNDFFASIGKSEKPVKIGECSDLSKIEDALAIWRPGKLDLNPLIEAAPFRLKI